MWRNIRNFLFKNITNRQTFAKNAVWLSISNIGGRFIRAGIIVYAARILGAEGWGLFSYGITLVAFLTIFVDIGIDPILIREAAKEKQDQERRNKILSTSFFIKASLLAAGVLVVVVVAPFFSFLPGVKPLLPLMALILVFDTLRNFGSAIIQSREKMELQAGLYIFTNIAIVAFGFLFLYLRPTPISFTLSYAAGTALGMLATLYVLREEIPRALFHFSKSLVKEILTSAWPFAVSGVLGVLMVNTDVLIIGFFGSAEQVGFYSAAVRIVQILYIFSAVAAQSSLPIFSRFIKNEKEKIRGALENILKFAFSFSLPVALGGVISGAALIKLLFGSEYLPATLSFQILLLTLAFNFVAVVLSTIIFVYDRQKVLIIYAAIGGILNVIFDLLLIPALGIKGSAIATLGAQIIADGYLWFIAWRIVRFNPFLKLKKVIISSAIFSLVLLLLLKTGVHVIFALMGASAVYIALLQILGESLLRDLKAILMSGASS
ncbi:MAG: flippase [Candidatus Liptonbacteria bacterium]|nr:flippase [Candidatus Liptonbacteria bacterium]